MEEKELIYVCEDEENIRELIRCTLQAFQYESETFESAEALLKACAEKPPRLVLLDIMLPGIDGVEALRRLKLSAQTKETPVIMLTAKGSEVDKVTALDAGADDYIMKPFGILELTARIRTVLRRVYAARSELPGRKRISDIELDIFKHEVTVSGRKVELTLKEYELLKTLMMNAPRVLGRDMLLNEVWGYDFAGETRTLDMHIRTLRAKIGDEAEHPRYIKTVRGVGYQFLDETAG
ncbi:response regulator transcription factor [Candidatus Soleaferrea massiliensis]|uniref:response regulator transcription factor n=1 Tax=Candidatus Soleaferrea massiliensis TaxID=1470354 RepID=UPI00058FB5D7|nr:response regulator transcription factor [Candidatus Soleaferrea massiliensis]